MIDIREKNETQIIVYMDNFEPIYKLVAFILSLYKKRFVIDKVEPQNDSKLIFFNKSLSSYLRMIISLDFPNNFIKYLNVTKYSYNETIKFSLSVNDAFDLSEPNYLTKFLRGTEPPENLKSKPLHVRLNLDVPLKKEINQKLILDTVNKFYFLEQNKNLLKLFYQLCNDDSASFDIGMKSFHRLQNYKISPDELDLPSQESKQKFIDLCKIFINNSAISELKFKNLITFIRYSYRVNDKARLTIKFPQSLTMINNFTELDFDKYPEHPVINYLASFLEINNLMDSFELELSKQIIVNT